MPTVVDLELPSESASDIVEGGAVMDGYFMVPSESSKRTDRLRSLSEEEGPEKILSPFFLQIQSKLFPVGKPKGRALSFSPPLQ